MLKVRFMLGGAANRYHVTGKVPSPKWVKKNGGSVFFKTFKTQAEYERCVSTLNATFNKDWAYKIIKKSEPAPQPVKELRAFIWDFEHYPRNVTDEKLLEAYHCMDESLHEVECLTLDKLAARINDGTYDNNRHYIRFIEIELPG